jgi:ribonuclease HI
VPELIKIPSQKEKLKAINAPNDKGVIEYQGKSMEHHEDLPVVLHNMDWTKEENPHFFASLAIKGLMFHNCMYDSGPSSNIMTKNIMERLGLKVTRPYHNVCAMDSREIETHGVIIDLQVNLVLYPNIAFKMDVLVIDVPDAWGMLLSRKWAATIGGCIQMDLSYATIPLLSPSSGSVRLLREKERKFHIEDPKEPMNKFVYHVTDMGRFLVCSNFLAPVKEKFKDEKINDKACKMNFDGTHSRSGKWAGIVLKYPTWQSYNFAFRLEFDATNNVAEYEALLLGLEITKDTGVKILNIKGDFDLVILQVKNKFACRSERLKMYRNVIWDTIELFDVVDLISIPREHNSLVVSASTLQPSKDLLNGQGKMEKKFRPSVPDNINHWQVFINDEHILRFIHNVQEFSGFNVSYKE